MNDELRLIEDSKKSGSSLKVLVNEVPGQVGCSTTLSRARSSRRRAATDGEPRTRALLDAGGHGDRGGNVDFTQRDTAVGPGVAATRPILPQALGHLSHRRSIVVERIRPTT